MLMLSLGPPTLPPHLKQRNGFIYAKLVTASAKLPHRFRTTPPRTTIVAGLERDAFGMRARFEAMVADATVDREELRGIVGACFAGMFGLRDNGPGRAGFLAWVKTLPADLTGLVNTDDRPDDARVTSLASRGWTEVSRDWETGHIPADHDSYLYDFAELVPALATAYFDQWVSRRRLHSEEDVVAGAYRLHAWLGGKRYEAPATDGGDYVDTSSILGFLNSILVACRDDHRLVTVAEGEVVLLGRRAALAKARRDYEPDDE